MSTSVRLLRERRILERILLYLPPQCHETLKRTDPIFQDSYRTSNQAQPCTLNPQLLPLEVTQEILQYLSPSDLYSASCTCSWWRQAAKTAHIIRPQILNQALYDNSAATIQACLIATSKESSVDLLWAALLNLIPQRPKAFHLTSINFRPNLERPELSTNHRNTSISIPVICVSDQAALIGIAATTSISLYRFQQVPYPSEVPPIIFLGSIQYQAEVNWDTIIGFSVCWTGTAGINLVMLSTTHIRCVAVALQYGLFVISDQTYHLLDHADRFSPLTQVNCPSNSHFISYRTTSRRTHILRHFPENRALQFGVTLFEDKNDHNWGAAIWEWLWSLPVPDFPIDFAIPHSLDSSQGIGLLLQYSASLKEVCISKVRPDPALMPSMPTFSPRYYTILKTAKLASPCRHRPAHMTGLKVSDDIAVVAIFWDQPWFELWFYEFPVHAIEKRGKLIQGYKLAHFPGSRPYKVTGMRIWEELDENRKGKIFLLVAMRVGYLHICTFSVGESLNFLNDKDMVSWASWWRVEGELCQSYSEFMQYSSR